MAVLPGDRESRWGELEQLLAGLGWAGRALRRIKRGEPVGPRVALLVLALKFSAKTTASQSKLAAGSAWLARYRCWQREAARDTAGWSPAERIEFAGIPEERLVDLRLCDCLIDGADDPELPAWFRVFSSKASTNARWQGVRQEDTADCVQSFFVAPWVRRLLPSYEPRIASLSAFLHFQFARFHVPGWRRIQSLARQREDLFANPPESADSAGSPELIFLIRELVAGNLDIPGVTKADVELLWQHDVVGKTFEEIAAERGCSPGSLRQRASEARRRFRDFLGGLSAGV